MRHYDDGGDDDDGGGEEKGHSYMARPIFLSKPVLNNFNDPG